MAELGNPRPFTRDFLAKQGLGEQAPPTPEESKETSVFTEPLRRLEELKEGVVSGFLKDDLRRIIAQGIMLPTKALDFTPSGTIRFNPQAGPEAIVHIDGIAERADEIAIGSDFGDFGRVVGDIGSEIALGVGAFGAGRAVLTRTLGAVAKRFASTGRVAARARDIGGTTPTAKPFVERAAETLGGAGGFGALGGAEALAEGATVTEAGRAAAVNAAFVVAFEGALIGVGKVFRRGREVDVPKVEARFRERIIEPTTELVEPGIRVPRLTILDQAELRRSRSLSRIELEYNKAVNVAAQERQLEIGFMFGAEVALPKSAVKLSKKIASTRNQIELIREIRAGRRNPLSLITRDMPLNPIGTSLVTQDILARVAKTPEAFGQQLGVSGAMLLDTVASAEAEFLAARSLNRKHISILSKRIKSALKGRKESFIDVVDTFEKEGADAVAVTFGRELADVMKVVKDGMARAYKPLVERGAEPTITSAALRSMGIKEFFPHVLGDLPEKAVRDRLVKSLSRTMFPEQAERTAQRILNSNRKGLESFGSIDQQRIFPGSLKDKIASGAPFVDEPLLSLETYMNAVAKRQAYGSRLGNNGELADVFVSMIEKEGGSVHLARTITDSILGRTHYDHGMRRVAQSLTSLEIGFKLPFAVLPNMSQPVLAAVFAGITNLAKGAALVVKKEERRFVADAVGLSESFFQSFRRIHMGETLQTNIFDRFGEGVLKWTGFSAVEKFNRFLGGASTLVFIRKDLAKATAGKLRGTSLDSARRRMATTGLNLDAIVKDARALMPKGMRLEEVITRVHGEGALERAMLRGAQRTQFIPGRTRIPVWWNHPVGRVMFQFKTFGLQFGRFLRDEVIAEAARGNLRPLATAVAMYPIAGEAVANLSAIAKQKERDQEGLWRLLDDIMAVGGLGLYTQAFMAAKFAGLGEFFLGPSAGEPIRFIESFIQSGGRGLLREVLRTPAVQALVSLATVGAVGFEQLQTFAEGDEDLADLTFEESFSRERQRR